MMLFLGMAPQVCRAETGNKELPVASDHFTHVHTLSELSEVLKSQHSIAIRVAPLDVIPALERLSGVTLAKLAIYNELDAALARSSLAALNVRHLELHCVDGTDDDLRVLGAIKSIETLYLAVNDRAKGAFLAALTQERLRHIGIVSFSNFDSGSLRLIAAPLAAITYSGPRAGSVFVAATSMASLEHIMIDAPMLLFRDTAPAAPVGMVTLPPRLRSLALRGQMHFEGAALSRLWKSETLSDCALEGFFGLAPESFTDIGCAKALRCLAIHPALEEVGYPHLNQESLAGIDSLPHIDELCLSGPYRTEDVLRLSKAIAKCRRLELRSGMLDSRVCEVLSRAERLKSLVLSITNISPTLLGKSLGSLEFLYSVHMIGSNLVSMTTVARMLSTVSNVHFAVQSIEDGGLLTLAADTPALPPTIKSVSLSYFGVVSHSVLKVLCGKEVHSLEFRFVKNIGSLTSFILKNTGVSSLSFFACDGFVSDMFSGGTESRCTDITFTLCANVTDQVIGWTTNLQTLRVINITGCSQVTLDGILKRKRVEHGSVRNIRWV
jgi:hypothetical protein